MDHNREAYRRRAALQLAAQLPDDREEALAVLEIARRLVGFVSAQQGQPTPQNTQNRVLGFPGLAVGLSSERAR
jgi:hypothetical protein